MKTILIIDDDRITRSMISHVLRNDFQLVEAEDSDTGLMKALSVHPDMIFLDIVMPGSMDGKQLLKVLKNDPRTKDIPVIMMTGSDYFGASESLKCGATEYFTKPFSPFKLALTVRDSLSMDSARHY